MEQERNRSERDAAQRRAERIAQKEKKRRRRMIINRIKVGTVFVLVLGVVLYLLSAFVLFKTSGFEVKGIVDENGKQLEGSSYYSSEQITEASGIEIGGSLVRISPREAEKRIERLLPYIGKAQVKRKYPDTVVITVEDTSPFYFVKTEKGYALLNSEYKVLETLDKKPEGCGEIKGVVFSGLNEGETAVFSDGAFGDRIKNLTASCEEAGFDLSKMTSYDLTSIAAVKIVYEKRFTLILGTLSDLEGKLSMGMQTIKAETEENSEARIIIDVTNPDRSYVRDNYEEPEEETSEEEIIAVG